MLPSCGYKVNNTGIVIISPKLLPYRILQPTLVTVVLLRVEIYSYVYKPQLYTITGLFKCIASEGILNKKRMII